MIRLTVHEPSMRICISREWFIYQGSLQCLGIRFLEGGAGLINSGGAVTYWKCHGRGEESQQYGGLASSEGDNCRGGDSDGRSRTSIQDVLTDSVGDKQISWVWFRIGHILSMH